MSNAGWTEETEVDFEGTPDELVNLPDALYVFDISKVTPQKTKAGKQAIQLVLKAVSVYGGGEVPLGAKALYETVMFDPSSLFSAKNLLKTLDVPFPKKVNFEILTDLAAEILEKKQVMAKTVTSAASGGFAAKARVQRFYTEVSLSAAQASGESATVTEMGAAPKPRTRRGASEQAAA